MAYIIILYFFLCFIPIGLCITSLSIIFEWIEIDTWIFGYYIIYYILPNQSILLYIFAYILFLFFF